MATNDRLGVLLLHMGGPRSLDEVRLAQLAVCHGRVSVQYARSGMGSSTRCRCGACAGSNHFHSRWSIVPVRPPCVPDTWYVKRL